MKKITRAFALTLDQIATIAKNFAADITQGLSGQESSLKLLPSFLTKPTGEERGSYLALDFGGTNVRTLLVTLSGQGQYQIEKNQSAPLTDPNSNIDLISADSNAEALFDFIALRLKDLLVPTATYELGHTFSFPCSQLDVNTAILLQWTKELKTPGVEGQNITQLLEKALKRHELSQITCRAVINDTVGTLLTAAYLFPQADIGSILGTGHNTCYLEPHAPLTGKPMILNLESGNFDKLFPNCYDMQLDSESEKPGQQLLEKMVSGRYLGELVRLCLQDLSLRHPEILPECLFVVPYSLDTKELSLFLGDTTPELSLIADWLATELKVGLPLTSRHIIKQVSSLITTRSAQLAAATYWGILQKIDPELLSHHTIAIDGSLYEKLPGYADILSATLTTVLGTKAPQVKLALVKDGSGIGAALAAHLAKTSEER